jgi:uncharacterized protein
MNVVLIGASGMIGSRVLKELTARGHRVTALVRDPAKVATGPGVTVVKGDINDVSAMTQILRGADAVVSAYHPGQGTEQNLIPATRALLTAARQAGVKRVIIAGGAASLLIAPEKTLLDSGHLPKEWVTIAKAHSDLLDLLRTANLGADLDWTYFSPAGFIQPGQRTGKFRLGKDEMVADEQGQSRISAEDYAVALVDELEQPRHVRERFTVGY